MRFMVLAMLCTMLAAGCTKKFTPEDIETDAPVDSAADTGPDAIPDGGPDCGNGDLDTGEECDDGNRTPGDGCEPDCTWTCEEAGDCDDGEQCNGLETCNEDHVCVEGSLLPDGTLISPGSPRTICLDGATVESECGDGFVDTGGGEFCDPPGVDGCTDDCVYGCETDEDCPDDLNPCNGTEYCNPSGHVCDRRDVPPSGADCDDGNPCTETDACDGAGTCVGSGDPCVDGLDCTDDHCDSTSGACTYTVAAGWCWISDVCYRTGETNPGNVCEVCDTVDPSTWSDAPPGTTCDDGDGCTSADECVSGVCRGTTETYLFGADEVRVGGSHACARIGGEVRCWGWNSSGQLGDSSTTDHDAPVAVTGLSDAASLASGHYHNCVVTTGGAARCWGGNGDGQIGDNTLTTRTAPVDVHGLGSGVAQISAGYNHTCAVLTSGEVRCWGDNGEGQLGTGARTDSRVPVAVRNSSGTANLTGIEMVTCGNKFTCALTTAEQVYCWGDNQFGQLGDSSTVDSDFPVAVCDNTSCSPLLGAVQEVDAHQFHACARDSSGRVKCWGHNSRGQLGNHSNAHSSVAVTVQTSGRIPVSGATSIELGFFFSCAVVPTGNVVCWGYNNSGQLGDGGGADRNYADYVERDSGGVHFAGVSQVAAGGEHACALLSGGDVWCWGNNHFGRCGDGTSTTPRPYPVHVLCSD